ncbi:MAG: zinc-ribbon domain-containing protein [Pseudoruegeria sp.]
MRLICPNCDAQYEVDDAVIPDNGRDVQCSNCSNTWFQTKSVVDEDGLDEPGHLSEQINDPDSNPVESSSDPTMVPEEFDTEELEEEGVSEPEDDAPVEYEAYEDEDEPVDEEFEDPSAAPSESILTRRQKVLDESILGILKEEAERESIARQRDGTTGIETQTDLGLEEPTPPTPEPIATPVQERTARLRGIEPDVPDEVDATRSDLLPDIDQINSSLQSTSERDGEPPTAQDVQVQEKSQRRGFRLGFSLMIILMALLILTYTNAPKVVELAPQSEAIIGQYVDLINQGRIGMNQLVEKAAGLVSGMGSDAE